MTDIEFKDELDSDAVSSDDLRDLWSLLTLSEKIEGLRLLPRNEAEDFFFNLTAAEQAEIIFVMPVSERRSWMRLQAPDDAADLLQHLTVEKRNELLPLLDDKTKHEVTALMAYAEDAAGGVMSTRFARLRPDMITSEAISYLRKQTQQNLETIYYIYVLDEQQHLLGVVSFRELFSASPDKTVREVMRTNIIKANEHMDQEALSRLFSQHSLLAIPIVDEEDRLKGIVTVDDIVDVVQEEATEDIQKMGGMEALDAPYLSTSFFDLLKKRAGWLIVLFVGEMLTASAMSYFEGTIAKAVVLALFIPLIISSGGNSGSQATTLVIRALSLGEVKLKDWWRIMKRELMSGFLLGGILGCIGFVRILVWQKIFHIYGEQFFKIALTVFLSLIGVVSFGTFAGAMLPFLLKKFKFDPASASAPLVATLVDVSGLVIYFTVASIILAGTLL